MIKPILGAIVALALLGTAALAQGITQDDVVAACVDGSAQQSGCLNVVHAYLQSMDAATVDAAVADLVVALASAGGGRAVMVAAIREAATFSTDADQAARIDEIAATIAGGDTGGTAAIGEVPSSPA